MFWQQVVINLLVCLRLLENIMGLGRVAAAFSQKHHVQ